MAIKSVHLGEGDGDDHISFTQCHFLWLTMLGGFS